MQVQYIFNSSFIVELESHILLFDYYKGKLPTFNPNKPLYVFVSHNHHDHYNPTIYTIDHPNITYIIDKAIDNKGIKVGPHEKHIVDDIEIQTLLSTDLGVAFVIYVEKQYIYHAGDLHWWHWEGEPETDNNYQKETFQQEINTIKHIPFTLMMIPLDPRLETSTTWGMQYIMEHIQSKYVLPMHFFIEMHKMLTFLDIEPLSKYSNILKIHNRGQKFILDV